MEVQSLWQVSKIETHLHHMVLQGSRQAPGLHKLWKAALARSLAPCNALPFTLAFNPQQLPFVDGSLHTRLIGTRGTVSETFQVICRAHVAI